jgi:GntR family transcriptional regulator
MLGKAKNESPATGEASPVAAAPTFVIDQKSDVPLHAQVRELLRTFIRKPEYQNGALLPDEVTLANRLGVSRGTLRAGIAKLVDEGLLERKPGRGTRVLTQQLQSGIGAWRSFTREMAAKGIVVETYSLDARMVPLGETVAQALRLKPGLPVVRLDRLRGWGGQPVVHSRSWLHPRLGLGAKEDFHQPLYELIERQSSVIVDHASEEIEAVAASGPIAELLEIARGCPVLFRRHTVFDAGDRAIEHAEVHYRSDRFTLTLAIRREAS